MGLKFPNCDRRTQMGLAKYEVEGRDLLPRGTNGFTLRILVGYLVTNRRVVGLKTYDNVLPSRHEKIQDVPSIGFIPFKYLLTGQESSTILLSPA